MWSPNELLKTEKQRDILSYITLQFFPFKKVPLEHYPLQSVSIKNTSWLPEMYALSDFLIIVFVMVSEAVT